jgi:cathepsin A (carboxypeptidase C)
MKLVASSILLGAASAALAPQQQVLKNTHTAEIPLSEALKSGSDAWSKAKHLFSDSLSGITAEAKAAWDEVAMHFPEDMEKAFLFPSPKPNHRKPDSAWDYVVKGADVQSVWVENAEGQKEREIDGKLETYNLRAKRVDPSKLGVDKVKQFSGYLDDEENDKHLFYCESSQSWHVDCKVTTR